MNLKSEHNSGVMATFSRLLSYPVSKTFAALIVMMLFAGLFAGCSESSGNNQPSPSRTGLLISDIHFNPLMDATIANQLASAPASQWDSIFATSVMTACATYMQDTNFALLNTAIAAMKAQTPNPDIIIISGDMLVHYFQVLYDNRVTNPTAAGYKSLVNTTEEYLAMKLMQAFPNAQILPTLGDWDSDMGVVRTPASSAFLQSFASTWYAAVNRNGSSPGFLDTFSTGGYYSAEIPINPNIRLIGLYTQPWAEECTSGCSTLGDAEMHWFTQELQDAKEQGQKVWLLGHIPPGIDANTTAINIRTHGQTCQEAVTPFWADVYSSQLYALFAQYNGTIDFGVFAHEHYDDFRLVNDSSGNFLFGVKFPPSITPLHNNPAFIAFNYDPGEGVITDASTSYLTNLASNPTADTAVWGLEYAFDSAYLQDTFDSRGLLNAVSQIIAQPVSQQAYINNYPVLYPAGNVLPGGLSPFLGWACALNKLTVADYTGCACQ